MLVDGFHELLWPEPDVVVLVHQQERLLWNLLLDLRHRLWIQFLEVRHESLHVLLIATVEQKRLHLHASLQLCCELNGLREALLALVQIYHSPISLVTEKLRHILCSQFFEHATD